MNRGTTLTRPGLRGYRAPGGGYASVIDVPAQFRGSTAALAGLRPFPTASAAPMVGVPLGPAPTGRTVCGDPISWFERAHLIANPSAFVLGRPGLGKSTLVRRLVLGLAGTGVTPLVLGDLKPDYTTLVTALGGQVVRLGRDQGVLNVLDPGGLATTARGLPRAVAEQVRVEVRNRQLTIVLALVQLARGGAVTELERTALAAALQDLQTRRTSAPPTLHTLMDRLLGPTSRMLTRTLCRSDEEFAEALRPLLHSVRHLIDSPMGAMFAGPTSTALDLTGPALAVDISAVPIDADLQAAALLATWADGFAAVEAANVLTDAGLSPQRRFLIVLDELWRALRAGSGIVDRLDALTRLNRAQGVGQVMITHSLKDLDALPNPADRAKAAGFVERAGMLLIGGVPEVELDAVTRIAQLTRAERGLVASWSSPTSLTARRSDPPGMGRFLIKVGTRPGIEFQVRLTHAERAADIHDTNQRWSLA